MLTLGKYSVGVGDRFAHQAKAQLQACVLAAKAGVEVIPVWNKSNREHTIIGSEPGSVRTAADAAVKELKWTKPYHVDADHIRLETVERFLPACDFYTIDVADSIGQAAGANAVQHLREPAPGAGRHAGHPRRVGAVHHHPGGRGAGRRQVPQGGEGRGRDLQQDRLGEGFRQLHHRSVDGRDRRPADAARTAVHPRRARRRAGAGADHRPEVHRAVQQGRRLRRRPRAVREGVPRRPRGDRVRGEEVPACRRT